MNLIKEYLLPCHAKIAASSKRLRPFLYFHKYISPANWPEPAPNCHLNFQATDHRNRKGQTTKENVPVADWHQEWVMGSNRIYQ